MGFLGTRASSFSDLVLIAQTAGFLILFAGFIYARKKNFLKHDKLTKIAVLLGSLAFAWMGYSLIFNFLPFISMTFKGLLIVSHVIIGLLALFMGIFLVLMR
jgi:ammonia channel protein AmtB